MNRTGKTAYLGLLLAFSLILSYIETWIPFGFGIPGMKLGLANLTIVLCLYLYDWKCALTINVLRIILSGFLFGNLAAILYSLCGALCSFICMLAMKRSRGFSMTGVSIGGGVFHNIGQILVAMAVVQTYQVAYYLPALLVSGTITGLLLGMIASSVYPHIQKTVRNGD